MWLIVGLGNPGTKYEKNRHNAGFMAISAIARRFDFPGSRQRFKGETSLEEIGDTPVLLLCPLTFMNLSGESVGEAARYYKIAAERILVFHDELDLLPGKIRVKQGGGDGGHNGLKSLDQHLGKDYWRVRIGIGHPGEPELVTPYVLGDFTKHEKPLIENTLEALAEALPLFLEQGADAYMNKVALILKPPPEKKEPGAAS